VHIIELHHQIHARFVVEVQAIEQNAALEEALSLSAETLVLPDELILPRQGPGKRRTQELNQGEKM